MTEPTRILLTDAHSTSALGVARSLGSDGMRVTAAGERGRFNLAAHSRFVSARVTWPDADRDPEGYLSQLEAELRRTSYDVLIPTTDTSISLIRRRRSTLEALTLIALPPERVLAAAQDKAVTVRIAQAHEVRVPKTWNPQSNTEVERFATEVSYPCVVKPRSSSRWDATGALIRESVRYADSPDALRRIFRTARGGPGSLLVQQLVQGQGVGVFVLANAGQPLAVFVHRRLREANPTGGRASLAESIAPEPRLVDPALRLLAALEWTGVAMVEFKDPGPPEEPVLMEINGRFWGSLPLAIAAGVDFPRLLVQLVLAQPVSAVPPYAVGVRCRHLKGDISYAVAAMKGRPRHWRGHYPGRVAALASVTPWPGRWRSYNFSVDDPMPGLREAGDFLLREVGRVLTTRNRTSRVEEPS